MKITTSHLADILDSEQISHVLSSIFKSFILNRQEIQNVDNITKLSKSTHFDCPENEYTRNTINIDKRTDSHDFDSHVTHSNIANCHDIIGQTVQHSEVSGKPLICLRHNNADL